MMTNDPYTQPLHCFLVGGAVRDLLLGKEAKDRDWVVVGSSPEQMRELGFIPVGEAFPVFLHPITKEEYALARSEKKSGHGYKGFTFYAHPEVTLEEDLSRRDLTINAIARSQTGAIIDPFNGVSDLEHRIFRHVGPAFTEDPLRVLRLARFHAQFSEFSMAPETLELSKQISQSNELSYLAKERILVELMKGLRYRGARRMFCALEEMMALESLFPSIDQKLLLETLPFDAPLDEIQRYALMSLAFTDPRTELHQYLKASRELSGFAEALHLFHAHYKNCSEAGDYVNIADRLAAVKHPDRYARLLQVVHYLFPDDQNVVWVNIASILAKVSAEEISKKFHSTQGAAIKAALHEAKTAVLQAWMDETRI